MGTQQVFGSVLRDMRTERGLTLRQVQSECFVSIGHLSDIERGTKQPSLEVLEGILTRGLKSSLSDFFLLVSERLDK